MSMALTEPNAGSNTLATETRAEDKGDHYLINGSKQFISAIQQSKAMLLITRTKLQNEITKRTDGLTLFIVDEPTINESIRYQPLNKLGQKYVPTNQVWITDLKLPKEAVLGEIDAGWYHIVDVLNPERITAAACAVGAGELAIEAAVKYAKERQVFGRPIGSKQGIQFPLDVFICKDRNYSGHRLPELLLAALPPLARSLTTTPASSRPPPELRLI